MTTQQKLDDKQKQDKYLLITLLLAEAAWMCSDPPTDEQRGYLVRAKKIAQKAGW